MRIAKLSDDTIYANYEKIERVTRRKLYADPRAAFHQGWNAAIRFAIRVEDAQAICEQCGKLIRSNDDYNVDAAFTTFCAKCYDKLFTKGGQNA